MTELEQMPPGLLPLPGLACTIPCQLSTLSSSLSLCPRYSPLPRHPSPTQSGGFTFSGERGRKGDPASKRRRLGMGSTEALLVLEEQDTQGK